MKLFQTSSVIESISTRADKTLKIVISTQELTPEQSSLLMALHQKQGWLLFSENAISETDIPKENAPEFKGKDNPMASLNRTLYVYWDTCTNRLKPFNEFVREWCEKKKTEIKEYLPK